MEDYFFFSSEVVNLLFYNWNTSSWTYFSLTFLCFLVLSFILEILAYIEQRLSNYYCSNPLQWKWSRAPLADTSGRHESSTLMDSLSIPSSLRKIKKRRLKIHITRSAVHLLRIMVGYILMLAVMTFNAYFLLAAVSGAGCGYFVFAPLRTPRHRDCSPKSAENTTILADNSRQSENSDEHQIIEENDTGNSDQAES